MKPLPNSIQPPELIQALSDLAIARVEYQKSQERATEVFNRREREIKERAMAQLAARRAKPEKVTSIERMALTIKQLFEQFGLVDRGGLARAGFTNAQINRDYDQAFNLATSICSGLKAHAAYDHA